MLVQASEDAVFYNAYIVPNVHNITHKTMPDAHSQELFGSRCQYNEMPSLRNLVE